MNRSQVRVTYEYASGVKICNEDDAAKARILDKLVQVLDMNEVGMLWRLVAARHDGSLAMGPPIMAPQEPPPPEVENKDEGDVVF